MNTFGLTRERCWLLSALLAALAAGCSPGEASRPLLTAGTPLHLEEHLDSATIESAEIPMDVLKSVEWRFDNPQPDWKPVDPIPEGFDPVAPVRVGGALRMSMSDINRMPSTRRLLGAIYVELPGWKLEDWSFVEIQARTSDPMRFIGLDFNYTEKDSISGVLPFYAYGDRAPLITDGKVHPYPRGSVIPLRPSRSQVSALYK